MVQSVLAVGMIVCLCIWGIDKIKVSLSALNNKSGLELTENDDGLTLKVDSNKLLEDIHENRFHSLKLYTDIKEVHALHLVMGVGSVAIAGIMLDLLVRGI